MEKFKSRKFWFALIGALLPIVAALLTQQMPVETAVMESVAIIMAYIFGQAYVDANKEPSPPADPAG